MFRNKTPDDSGWYWLQADGHWWMAFVDVGRDEVTILDGHDPDWRNAEVYDLETVDSDLGGVLGWHGPIVCPGGDFGGITVLIDQETRDLAAAAGEVIVLRHADYHHASDEKSHGTVTVVSRCDRGRALELTEASR